MSSKKSSKKPSKQKVFSSLEEDEISKLSIESTDEEQYPSDHEYTVERILAQKSKDGQQLYLIRWANFPEEASSWEPRRNLLDKTIIDAWKGRRIRESEGLDTPYDVGKLEALKKMVEDSKAQRDRLRREKRKRLGIVVSPPESDADDGDKQPTSTHAPVSNSTLGGEKSSERQQQVQSTKKTKIIRPEQIDAHSSSEEPLFVNPQRKATSGASSPTKVPQVQKKLQKHVTLQGTASDTQETTAAKGSSAFRGVQKTRGGGAMRGGSSLPSQNVFNGGKAARKKKAGLIEAAADPLKDQRHFKNRHLIRKAELAGRALADAAPDITAIPGGLIKPSKASSVQRPETLRRIPSPSQNEEGNIRRMAPAQPPHNQQQDLQRLPNNLLHVSEMPWEDVQHIPYEQRSICFFFSRPQGCHNSRCKYLHVDDPLLPIAPPPDGWFESQKICFFYNSDGNCRNGDTCKDLHESGTNLPVNKPPPGWVVPGPSTKVMLREAHVPVDVDVPKLICFDWQHRKCHKGNACKFAHPNDNDFPVAPKPGSIPCKYWKGGFCWNKTNCHFLHESAQDSRRAAYMSQVYTKVANFGTSDKESSQLPLQGSKSIPIFDDSDTLNFEMDTVSDFTPLEPNLTECEKSTNFDNYSMDKTVQSIATNVKAVTFGPQDQPIYLDFENVPLDTSDWTRAFASVDNVRFDQMCTAHDFKLRYGQIQSSAFWPQDVSTNSTDQAGRDTVDSVAEDLCLRMAGLACISDTYIVLLYPSVAEEWKYLDVMPNISTGAKLKYLIFGSQSPVLSSIKSLTINQTSSKDLSYRDMMMKSFHHFDYEQLIPEQKTKKLVNFCLIFPASANHIAESISSWLRSCSKESKIYNYQKAGCWDYFKKHVKAGAVLIHSSALNLISDTDLIQDMTAGVNYSFWCIEDPTSKVPFSFNGFISPKSELGHIVTRRLLPLGCAILLTPSFLVAEPVMSLKLLTWYQKKLKGSLTGSVRILCCHELPNFLLELFISKVAEQQELMKSLAGDPSILSKLSERGLSQDQCEARITLYWLLCDMLRKDLPSHLSPFDRDPTEENSRSPLLFAPRSIDQYDEKKLVSWFSGWSFANLHKYRRFYVIGSGTSKKGVGIPVRMIPEEDVFPQNSKAFREGGALAWARRGREPISVVTKATEPPTPDPREVKLKEYTYDFTDDWYSQWKETREGRSAHHIIVHKWERVFQSLGIHH
ncbi:hypothetical protein SBOR_9666 [Sclerotinia borealis F-4128]|uniref:Chromo domain-containing protein n=1 Tax=Sclerotinia borealis (strain F-4128) TaxID=1432307 RepID=W9BZG0_SCLBF|nr:hypothetical protein SBOR_9666 [Sclerotinia borealis F-4128]